MSPFKSIAQQKFAHANPEKFGGKKGLEEWDAATDFKKIPKRVKTVKGGNCDLSPRSLKGSALLNDRPANLAVKQQFKSRTKGSKVKI